MKPTIQHLRWGRFLCWLKYGHCWNKTGSRRMVGREMNKCLICGHEEPGPG